MMTKSSVASCLLALLALFLVSNVNGVALAAKPVDSIEEAINSAPIRDLRKLGGKSTAAAGIAELNKFYGQHIINQKAVLKVKVEAADPIGQGRNEFKIQAAKTAVKLIFPLVIFIFPGIFVILVGPAAITMMRELFPLMGG